MSVTRKGRYPVFVQLLKGGRGSTIRLLNADNFYRKVLPTGGSIYGLDVLLFWKYHTASLDWEFECSF